jgi:hypothetical protein
MITKVLPFLNKLIPSGLAFKGLSKVNPKIGKYLSAVTAAGYSADEALGYLREQFQGEEPQQGLRPDEQAANARVSQGSQIPRALGKAAQIGAGAAGIGAVGTALPQVLSGLFGGKEQQAPTPENQQAQQQQQAQQPQEEPSILHQFAPKLASLVEESFGSGRTIDEVEAIALSPANGFSKVISHMEKALGIPFYEILRSIYGGPKRGQQQKAPPEQMQAQQAPQQTNLPAVQGQMGPGETRLTQALERLAKMRGG